MSTFNTYDYDFLLKCMNQGSIIFKSQAIKRLITLAGTDKKQFSFHYKGVLAELQNMYRQDKEEINVSATLLVGEIVGNIVAKQIEQTVGKRHLQSIIANLGHPVKTNLRKASHTCLLNYLKSYHNFQLLQQAYLKYGFVHQNQLIQQKSINSFQSILILEVKFYDFSSENSRKVLECLLEKIQDQNQMIGKAASQCVMSMCKLQGIKEILPNMNVYFIKKLKSFLEEISSKVNIDAFQVTTQQLQNIIEFNKPKNGTEILKNSIKLKNSAKQEDQSNEDQNRKESNDIRESQSVIQQSSKNNANQRRLQKIRNSMKQQQKKIEQKDHFSSKLFTLTNMDGTLKQRTQAVEDLLYKIQVSKNKPDFEPSIRAVFPALIKMLKDTNPKIVSITLRIMQTIIEQIASNEANLNNLITVIVQKLGDQKISIRQNVSKVIKQLIIKTNKGLWVRQLLDGMKKSTNTVLKDQTLYLLHYIYDTNKNDEIDYPTNDILQQISMYTDDPKTKIKIRTLDCLSAIVFRSNQREKYNFMLKGKMSAVFYQMYLQKMAKLQQQQDRKLQLQAEKKKKEQRQEPTMESYRTLYHQRNDRLNLSRSDSVGDKDEDLNISMQTVKKRVSLLRKPRNLLSTQQTMSVDNSSHRNVDKTIQDVDIMLPSLYKKTTTNRFIAKKTTEFTPNRTIDNKSSDYLSKDELKPLRQPQKDMRSILTDLKSTDWKIQFETTNKLRRVIEYHPEIIINSQAANIHSLTIDILAMIENLRSSVSKNALICLNEYIILMGKHIDCQMEIILQKLIKKSADTNIFISAEVQRCLNSLSASATASKVLQKLAVFRESKSIPVKDAVIMTLINMKNQDKIRQRQFAKLAELIGFFLTQAQIQIRSKAKIAIIQLCKSLGDWYRALRGKINPNCFKSICQLMTKSPNSLKKEEIPLSPMRIVSNREQFNTISIASTNQKAITVRKQTAQTMQAPPLRKRLTKVSQFPPEFNEIQTYLDLCNSSDWKKRIQSINKIKQIALQFPNEFMQYRSANHFIDIMCKQMIQPNVKVSVNAMDIFAQGFSPLKMLIQNNLGVISNSIFTGLSSGKVQIREYAQKCTATLLDEIEIQVILQHLSQGILYSLPKSRIYLVCKLTDKLEQIHQERKQLLFKHIFPLLNKLMEEYKAELMPHVVNLFVRLYDIMGNQMFSHLTKFKEVRELIDK